MSISSVAFGVLNYLNSNHSIFSLKGVFIIISVLVYGVLGSGVRLKFTLPYFAPSEKYQKEIWLLKPAHSAIFHLFIFEIWGLGFGVLGFGVWGLEFGVLGFEV